MVMMVKVRRYALYDLAKGATCISQGIVDGIGTERSFISHKNLQTSQDVKLQVSRLSVSCFTLLDVSSVLQNSVEIAALISP